jgi:hypothetical protein
MSSTHLSLVLSPVHAVLIPSPFAVRSSGLDTDGEEIAGEPEADFDVAAEEDEPFFTT